MSSSEYNSKGGIIMFGIIMAFVLAIYISFVIVMMN
jgi:hypothetical protein